MELIPLSNRIIVRPLKQEEQTKSGIFLPGNAEKERPEQGEVIAIGPGKLLENGTRAPLDVKVGDQVVFKKYGPDEVTIDDEDLLVLDDTDVLAIIKK